MSMKHPNIDLSKLVGKEVIVTFSHPTQTWTSTDQKLEGVVCENPINPKFQYHIDGWQFTGQGKGMSLPQIQTISLAQFTGLAHKHPNIDLKQFVNKKVLIKLNSLGGMFLTSRVYRASNGNYDIPVIGCILRFPWSGIGETASIEEIYDTDSYEINTSSGFYLPPDPAVEKAKEVLKGLTEQQIAKVLHDLKTP